MNTKKLLENAALDALGLLDDGDRDAFDNAFRAAAPEIQAQIRREQARFAGAQGLLPEVNPPASLKPRVLASVEREMARESETVGETAAVIGRVAPDIERSSGVSPIWRAVGIGSLAAAIVFAFTTLQTLSDFGQLEDAYRKNAMADRWIQDFGSRFQNEFMSPNTQFVQFTPAQDFRGQAIFLFNPRTNKGTLFCKDLPSTGEYVVKVVDPDTGETVGSVGISIGPGSLVYEPDPQINWSEGHHLFVEQQDQDGNKVRVLHGTPLRSENID